MEPGPEPRLRAALMFMCLDFRLQGRKGKIDLFAVYCPDNAKIYIWQFGDNPTQDISDIQKQGTTNDKIRRAKDYEFEKRVDDLRKEVELVGLEPTTSQCHSSALPTEL